MSTLRAVMRGSLDFQQWSLGFFVNASQETNLTPKPMAKDKLSSGLQVPMYVVGFIDSYCRRNLSVDEIQNIAEIFSAVENNDKAALQSLMARATQVVTQAPQKTRESLLRQQPKSSS